jgi:predicted RNase H-like nuclease (RuvC/YqgF family)
MINLKEAVNLTGKGLTTITRLARKYQNTKHVKKEGGQYYISKEWLTKIYPPVNHNNNVVNQGNESRTLEAKNETISILKSQLEQKDRQINELTERIRENNIIIQNLQSRLQIPESFAESNEVQPDPKENYKTIISDLHNQKYTSRQIAEYLNRQGYLNTLGNPFTKEAVKKIIVRMRAK